MALRTERFTPLMTFVNESLPSYPGLAGHLSPFFTLSYPLPTPALVDSFPQWQHYGIGKLDACYVITWILLFTILRGAIMSYIFSPVARIFFLDEDHQATVPLAAKMSVGNGTQNGAGNGHASDESRVEGIRPNHQLSKQEVRLKEKAVTRFSEQGWSLVYYAVYWSIGMYIHMNSPIYPFRPKYFWIGYPHQPLSAPLKFFYLTQLASWLHQLIILNIEARRKDHLQMLSHHLITISLIVASYVMNFTRVGATLLVLMDFCDALLPMAKMLRYLRWKAACDTVFIFFLLSWAVTRHVLFGAIIVSAYRDAPNLVGFRWAPSRGHYLTQNAYYAFLALLMGLQVLLCGWFALICKIAIMVAIGTGADDIRSDDEDELDEVTEAEVVGKSLGKLKDE